MVLTDPGRLPLAQEVPGLEIRRLEPEEAEVHAITGSIGFDMPEAVFRQISTPAHLRTPGTRAYIGTADGVPVTTGMGSTVGAAAGVFNIGTPQEFRGRGYGAAVTARVAMDGLVAGAEWAFLQSSEAGYRVYQSIGFETMERWDSWISAPS
jgi:hypothetical protein